MNCVFKTVFLVLFASTNIIANLDHPCFAQEKLRIDTKTVAVQKSPWKEIKLVAVGPSGTDLSTDLGNKWRKVSDKGFRVVGFAPDGNTGFAAGDNGRIVRWIPEAVRTKSVSAQSTKRTKN